MKTNPIAQGSLVAIAAAVLFGMSTPLVKHFGEGTGAFATATLLYTGAAMGSGVPRRRAGEPMLGRKQMGRTALVALFGAALAPAALAWGLQHSGALAASLLLNLEAIFTVVLARAVYREPAGRRFAVAASLMVAGGAFLALRVRVGGASSGLGLATLASASFCWALDNTLTRPLADFDPRAVVFWKSVLGGALTALAAWLLCDPWPKTAPFVALLACGATGYGLSLRLYLRAQRTLGAARTGSLFAVAPFVGAAVAFALGDRANTPLVLASATMFAAGVYLHVTESHHHRHLHDALEHEHAHRHDDGHHTHAHDPPVVGEHSHPHRHDAAEHDHPHGADLHHRHGH